MQRAENVTLVYNNSSDSKGGGECSRYILQLAGSNLYRTTRLALSAEQACDTLSNGIVQKTGSMVNALRERFDKGFCQEAKPLTPSAINRYIKCRLSFFYYYVLGLKPPKEVDVEMQATDFGIVFHKAAENLYNGITKNGRVVDANSIAHLLQNPLLLDDIVDTAFKETFFKGGTPVYNGEQYINRGMLKRFLQHLLRIDKSAAPLYYICGEGEVYMPYTIQSNGNSIELELGGTIDRIDVKGDTVNIIDYKTGGGSSDKKTSLEEIFAHEGSTSGYRLQSFLYSIVIDELLDGKPIRTKGGGCDWENILKQLKPQKVSPHLLYVHKEKGNATRKDYVVDTMETPVTDIHTIKEEFMKHLDGVLSEIFDEKIPFKPACDSDKCKYCDYKKICGK